MHWASQQTNLLAISSEVWLLKLASYLSILTLSQHWTWHQTRFHDMAGSKNPPEASSAGWIFNRQMAVQIWAAPRLASYTALKADRSKPCTKTSSPAFLNGRRGCYSYHSQQCHTSSSDLEKKNNFGICYYHPSLFRFWSELWNCQHVLRLPRPSKVSFVLSI